VPSQLPHPDRQRWDARYADGPAPSFGPHPLAVRALAVPPPPGPVADLASGPSGSALLAAAAGRRVTAVDISGVALGMLATEAARRGLAGLITVTEADLADWRPPAAGYALVLCTGFWDQAVFATAAAAVRPGGVIAWEAFTTAARQARPGLPGSWCLATGQPASLLPAGFTVLAECDVDGGRGARRRLLAQRQPGCQRGHA
jgi:SAM-dependent methyltransferase